MHREWVVTYWAPEKKEFRCEDQHAAMRFAMRLPASVKIFVDEVNFGDEVHVR